MARPASARLQGIVTVSGMVALIGALSIAPRVSITRTEDSTIIKYDHLKASPHTPPPSDPGVIIKPGPRPTSTTSSRRKPFAPTDWIFDTGATTHVCSNRALLHGYDTLNPYANTWTRGVVGFFGPNPVPIVGAGDCTLTLPALSASGTPAPSKTSATLGERVVTRVTVHNVMHIPTAGVNLISWSQLKRAKGLDLRLVEERDGSLTVRDRDRPLMRFELRDGLYFLVQDEGNVG
ncbi:uncharacterized protein Z518_10721 [Rhinocladiella mackenziei CBS 650.93]|uniref:Uncharacterized protein n=1 Tax=Rhinocladiella mackenziei CBS 650.93 TaxID=1442369 RepID=A0A0D2I220_9EURO|nr:uncharacterized protein Z518_10721 [Rhinocladiella mackenziei CBS 650.93]KIW99793.1 hypothetical protein Z518_10721 [Rhinocladiella mackenziei CBS 650.93]